MVISKHKILPPKGYVPLLGSEHHSTADIKLLGPANEAEIIKVTIVLRRRKDGPPLPDFDYFGKIAPSKHKRLSMDEFASKYGAHPDDIKKIVEFAEKAGMKIIETHPAKRTVVISGTVAIINSAFAIVLHRIEHKVVKRRGEKPKKETYRGRLGFIHVPIKLAEIIVGIFGLDNRRITKRNSLDPSGTAKIPIDQLKKLYNFPSNSAAGQTIAVFSEGGYKPSDIKSNFPHNPPKIIEINVDAVNDRTADAETTQDIYVVAAAAKGADIAVYFTTPDQGGWLNLVNRVVHPEQADPVCYVLSNSFYVSNSDDLGLMQPFTQNWIDTMTMAFQDAAIQKVTVCCASGDNGTDSKVGDKRAHVQYPATDPWVLTAGGTTIGNIHRNSFDEYLWNDTFDKNHSGATGGGISAYFARPSYQDKTRVPTSLNNGKTGRGVPDVAANASPNSGIPMIIDGKPNAAFGTSASAPLWAGMIALINASLGEPVGFINSHIYNIGSKVFRDITGAKGPKNNALAGAPGYPAHKGWDACTGWGSPNGVKLLKAFQKLNK
jgi:kumamolisin